MCDKRFDYGLCLCRGNGGRNNEVNDRPVGDRDQADAHARGRGRVRGNRGGVGRRQPRPRVPEDAGRPPRAAGEFREEPPAARTRPAHVKNSVPKNDPIYFEALVPEPGQESRPMVEELRLFPGCRAIPL